jgi:hypothetical protein
MRSGVFTSCVSHVISMHYAIFIRKTMDLSKDRSEGGSRLCRGLILCYASMAWAPGPDWVCLRLLRFFAPLSRGNSLGSVCTIKIVPKTLPIPKRSINAQSPCWPFPNMPRQVTPIIQVIMTAGNPVASRFITNLLKRFHMGGLYAGRGLRTNCHPHGPVLCRRPLRAGLMGCVSDMAATPAQKRVYGLPTRLGSGHSHCPFRAQRTGCPRQ